MLNFAKAIGANTDLLTAQAFAFPVNDNPSQLLVIVLSGCAEDGFTKIRKVGLDSKDLFFESDQGILDRFVSISQYIKEQLADFEKLEGVIGFFDQDSLYLQTINNFDTLLLRRGSVVNLTAGVESEKLISGLLEAEDRILFINLPLTDYEQQDLRQELSQDLLRTDFENLEFEVEAFLQQQSKSDPIATVLVQNYEEKLEQTKKINFEPPRVAEQSHFSVSQAISSFPKPHLPNLRLLILLILRLGIKKLLILAILIVVGLGILVSYGQKRLQEDKIFTAALQQAQQNLDKAVSLKDTDQPQAKQALQQAKSNLAEALKVKPKEKAALALQAKIQDQSYLVTKQYQVKDFPIFLDLNLIKQGLTTNRISYSLGRIGLLDKNNKTLISFKLDQKLPQILAGSLQLGDAQFASINGDNLSIFSKDKGVLSVDVGNGKVTTAVKPDPDWQRIVDIYGFAGNIYLLDEFKNQIWKYIVTKNGFSEKNSYLKIDVKADFAGGRILQIDGAIWVLKGEKKILKFIQGGEDFFAWQNFDQDISSIKSFYTSDETESIYFLDSDNSRLVWTKKNGQYVGEYKGDKFKSADDLVVDEKNKKIYLLESNKIYQIDLK